MSEMAANRTGVLIDAEMALVDWRMADAEERAVDGLPGSWSELSAELGHPVSTLRGWLNKPAVIDEMNRRLHDWRTSPDLVMRLEKSLVRQAEEGDPVAAEKMLRHFERIKVVEQVDTSGRGSAAAIDDLDDDEFASYLARISSE